MIYQANNGVVNEWSLSCARNSERYYSVCEQRNKKRSGSDTPCYLAFFNRELRTVE